LEPEGKTPVGCSVKEGLMFGKPGRPREDGFVRRRDIYVSVAPLIEKVGAKGFTMRQAANAAHMSLGGVYHYFPSKRDLALFGVSPEALQRSCTEFHQQYGHLARKDPEAFLAASLEALVGVVTFCRPALVAAVELGADAALDAIDAAMEVTLAEFVEPLKAVRPDLGDPEIDAVQRALRHAVIGAALDRSATSTDLRRELHSILELRLLARPGAGGSQAVAS
jgi:AcrR family transcriptional regulator